MIGFIAWQELLGIWLVGYFMGFASSIGVAAWIVYRRRHRESGYDDRPDTRPSDRHSDRTRH